MLSLRWASNLLVLLVGIVVLLKTSEIGKLG